MKRRLHVANDNTMPGQKRSRHEETHSTTKLFSLQLLHGNERDMITTEPYPSPSQYSFCRTSASLHAYNYNKQQQQRCHNSPPLQLTEYQERQQSHNVSSPSQVPNNNSAYHNQINLRNDYEQISFLSSQCMPQSVTAFSHVPSSSSSISSSRHAAYHDTNTNDNGKELQNSVEKMDLSYVYVAPSAVTHQPTTESTSATSQNSNFESMMSGGDMAINRADLFGRPCSCTAESSSHGNPNQSSSSNFAFSGQFPNLHERTCDHVSSSPSISHERTFDHESSSSTHSFSWNRGTAPMVVDDISVGSENHVSQLQQVFKQKTLARSNSFSETMSSMAMKRNNQRTNFQEMTPPVKLRYGARGIFQ